MVVLNFGQNLTVKQKKKIFSPDVSGDELVTITIRCFERVMFVSGTYWTNPACHFQMKFLSDIGSLTFVSIFSVCSHALIYPSNSFLSGVNVETSYFSHFPIFSHLHRFVFVRGDHGWI